MAPKKRPRKNDGSSSSRSFDSSKFINKEASEKYKKLENLKFIKERGFSKLNGMLKREVQIKGWNELYKHLEKEIAPIFREFYANLYGEQDGKAFVKGRCLLIEK